MAGGKAAAGPAGEATWTVKLKVQPHLFPSATTAAWPLSSGWSMARSRLEQGTELGMMLLDPCCALCLTHQGTDLGGV